MTVAGGREGYLSAGSAVTSITDEEYSDLRAGAHSGRLRECRLSVEGSS